MLNALRRGAGTGAVPILALSCVLSPWRCGASCCSAQAAEQAGPEGRTGSGQRFAPLTLQSSSRDLRAMFPRGVLPAPGGCGQGTARLSHRFPCPQVNQGNMPGIQSTFLAMDTEEGVEVVWNELLFTDKKSFKAHEVGATYPAVSLPTSPGHCWCLWCLAHLSQCPIGVSLPSGTMPTSSGHTGACSAWHTSVNVPLGSVSLQGQCPPALALLVADGGPPHAVLSSPWH